MKKRHGTLIVIDGIDGSGKATQAKLLAKRLKRENHTVKTIDFPQYEQFFGKLIGECLAGGHGDFVKADPYVASMLYAADRFDAKEKIRKWLEQGAIVIVDRYVSANQMHQGGKIKDARKRKRFLEWLDEMEHGKFGIPRPDAIVYLHIPVRLSMQLLKNKALKRKKQYLRGRKDLAEENVRYLENAQKSALRVIAGNNRWYKIDCAPRGELLSVEDIHEKIYAAARRLV